MLMVRLDEGGRAARDVQILAPPPSLRDWVQHVSIQPGPARRAAWRVVPDTCPHLIFIERSDGGSSCRIVGARSTYADIDVTGRRFTVAVRLQPGTLQALLGERAMSFTDRAFDVADVLGQGGRRLMDRLGDASPSHAARLLLDEIAVRCVGRTPPALGPLLSDRARVDGIQWALQLSARALHARMLATLGLAPKRALRIVRLLSALQYAGRGSGLSSAALAARYSDQAHFTREARALLGEPPAAWRRRATADSFKTGGG